MVEHASGFQKIACIGEVMLELVEDDSGAPVLGVAGDSYNTAVYLARALREHAASVAYVTALGTDPYSDKIISEILGHGIDDTYVARLETLLPGIYAIHTNDVGERSFSYWRANSAARSMFQDASTVTLNHLDGFDLIYLSGISVAILPPSTRQAMLDWIDLYRASGGMVAFDSNYRPRLWENMETARTVTRAFWERTDIALPSVDDEMALFGDTSTKAVLERLKSFGITRGALKRGAEGPLDIAQDRGIGDLPVVTDVVDTTAAGDSFNAGYLAQLAQGQSTKEALSAGHHLAARVICQRGAIIPELLS